MCVCGAVNFQPIAINQFSLFSRSTFKSTSHFLSESLIDKASKRYLSTDSRYSPKRDSKHFRSQHKIYFERKNTINLQEEEEGVQRYEMEEIRSKNTPKISSFDLTSARRFYLFLSGTCIYVLTIHHTLNCFCAVDPRHLAFRAE